MGGQAVHFLQILSKKIQKVEENMGFEHVRDVKYGHLLILGLIRIIDIIFVTMGKLLNPPTFLQAFNYFHSPEYFHWLKMAVTDLE